MKTPTFVLLTLLSLLSATAQAGTISGTVVDVDNVGLDKVKVCLAETVQPSVCVKTSQSNRHGNYKFNGIKAGDYVVAVRSDRSASGRKADLYKSYVWGPVNQTVSLPDNKSDAALDPITGRFNFSSFQRSLLLTSADFPELAQFDPYNETVFIKIYYQPVQLGEELQTVYLGRVGNPARLAVEASIPLATTELLYEIYSPTLAANSAVLLTN